MIDPHSVQEVVVPESGSSVFSLIPGITEESDVACFDMVKMPGHKHSTWL